MAGSDEGMPCQRNAKCKCPDCLASSASFSLSELKAITSTINYDDDGGNNSLRDSTSSAMSSSSSSSNNDPAVNSAPAPPQQQRPAKPKMPALPKPWKKQAAAPAAPEDEPPMQEQGQEEDVVVQHRAPPPQVEVKAAVSQDARPAPPARTESAGSDAAAPSVAEMEGSGGGGGGGAPPSEGGEGSGSSSMRPEEIDQGTLPARIADKNWKVRKEAAEQLAVLFSASSGPQDQVFATFEPHVVKLLDEVNASALDAALDAVLIMADRGPWTAGLTEAMVPVLVSKALPGRPSTVKKAMALLLKAIEVESPEPAVSLLLELGLSDKRPKVPPAALAVVLEAFKAFGGQDMPYRAIRDKLKGMFESTNKAVREGALELVKEVARWVGLAPFQPIFGELRSAQQTDIKDATSNIVPGQATPTVGLRKHRQAGGGPPSATAGANSKAKGSSSSSSSSGGPPASSGGGLSLDPYDLVDPVDLVERLGKTDFWDKVGKEPKWSDKLDGLNSAIAIIGDIPKLLPHGDMGELVRQVKALVQHSHIQVASASVRLLGLLSSGLREHYRPYAASTWGLLVGKAKDKKAIPAVTEALGQLWGKSLLSLEPLMDGGAGELEVALDAKKTSVPHVRQLTLEWLDKTIAATAQGGSKADIPPGLRPPLAKLLVKCVDDSDAKVREAAASTALKLVQLCRQGGGAKDLRAVLSVFEELKASHKKVYERLASSSPTSAAAGAGGHSASSSLDMSNSSALSSSDTGGGGTDAPPSSGGGPSCSSSSSSTTRSTRGPGATARSGLPSSSTLKRTAGSTAAKSKATAAGSGGGARAAPSASQAFGGGGGGKSSAAEEELSDDASLVSVEEATELLAGLGVPGWEESVLPGLESDKWQDRKEALATLRQHVASRQQGPTLSASSPGVFPALTVFLFERTKKFKDSNFNIIREALETALAGAQAVDKAAPNDRSAAGLLCSVALDKVTDKKLRGASLGLLTALAEVVGPSAVSKRVLKACAAAKAPAMHTEGLAWLKTCATEFGANRLPLQALVGLVVGSEVESSNAAIRKAAIELLGALYEQVGPPLKSLALVDSLKPQVRAAIQQEFDRLGFDPSKAAATGARKVKGEEEGAAGGAGGGALPRLDLGSLKGLLAEMGLTEGKNAWQTRKKAMEDLLAACDNCGHFIEANKACAEMLKALKARLADSQSNLKPIAAAAIAGVLVSLEPTALPKFFRLVGEPLLNATSDNKKVMRDAALGAVEAILTLGKGPGQAAHPVVLEAMVPALASALMHPVGRTELLTCAAPHMGAVSGEAGALLVGPLLDSLQDKTATARAAAEACLVPLLRSGAMKASALNNGMRDFAPAVKRSLAAPIARITEAAAQQQQQQQAAAPAAPEPSEQHASPPPPEPQDSSSSSSSSKVAVAPAPAATTTEQQQQQDDATADSLPRPPPATTAPPPPPQDQQGALSATTTTSSSRRPSGAGSVPGGSHHQLLGGVKVEDKIATALAKDNTAASPPTAEEAQQGGQQQQLKRHDQKKKREEAFARARWFTPPEEPRADDVEHLKAQWSPWLQAGEGNSLDRLFPPLPPARSGALVDPAVYMKGIDLLAACLDEALPAYVDHLDLIFKWFTLRLCDKENVQLLQKLLRLMVRTLEALRDNGYSLRDFEAAILVPFVLDKSGQSKDRFRKEFRHMMGLLCDVYPFSKYAPMVVSALGITKNTRTRAVCLDEVRRLIDVAGPGVLGKKGLKDVSRYVEARESEVRSAALEVMQAAYERLGRDQSKLSKLLEAASLSDKARALVEDKVLKPSASANSSSNNSGSSSSGGGGLNATATTRGSRLGGTPGKAGALHPQHSGGRENSLASANGAPHDDDDVDDDEDDVMMRGGGGRRPGSGSSSSDRRSSLELVIGPGPGLLKPLHLTSTATITTAGSTTVTRALSPHRTGGPYQFHDDDITYPDDDEAMAAVNASSPLSSPRSALDSSSQGGRSLLDDASRSGHDGAAGAGGGSNPTMLRTTMLLTQRGPPRLPVYDEAMGALQAYLALPPHTPLSDTSPELVKVKEALSAILGPSALRHPGSPPPLPPASRLVEEEALRLHGDVLVARVVDVLDRALLLQHHHQPHGGGDHSTNRSTVSRPLDARLALSALEALRHLYRQPHVCLLISPETLGHTLLATWTGSSLIESSSSQAFPPGDCASRMHDGLKRLGSEVRGVVPLHVTLAALLQLLNNQRLARTAATHPQSESAIKAFAKVVRHERAAACPFDRLDVAKIIAPLDAFFATHGPAPCRESEEAVSTLVEALVDRLGPHKLQAYMTLAGLESGSSSTASSLYRRIMAAAHRHGGGEQLAMAMVGKLPEVVELVQKVLDLHSDPESMKRLHGVLKGRPEIADWAEHLKLYHLSTQAQQHILINLARLEAGDHPPPLPTDSSVQQQDAAALGSSVEGDASGPAQGSPSAAADGSASSSLLLRHGSSPRSTGSGAPRPITPSRLLLHPTSSAASSSSMAGKSRHLTERIKQLREQLHSAAPGGVSLKAGASSASAAPPSLPLAPSPVTTSSSSSFVAGLPATTSFASAASTSMSISGSSSSVASDLSLPAPSPVLPSAAPLASSSSSADMALRAATLLSRPAPRNEAEQLASIRERLQATSSSSSATQAQPVGAGDGNPAFSQGEAAPSSSLSPSAAASTGSSSISLPSSTSSSMGKAAVPALDVADSAALKQRFLMLKRQGSAATPNSASGGGPRA